MASYKVIDPSFDKLTEIARITYQMLYYEKLFKRYKDPKDEQEFLDYKSQLEKWHEKNLELVNNSG